MSRINTDKLIAEFMEDITKKMSDEPKFLEELEGRLSDIADEATAQAYLSTYQMRQQLRRLTKSSLIEQFWDIFRETLCKYHLADKWDELEAV